MARLLTKKFVSMSPFWLFPSSLHRKFAISTPLFHFSTQAQQKEGVPFLAEYLVSSFGFSKDRALRISADKNLVAIKNSDRPESVVQFLKESGLTNMEIKDVISYQPRILSSNVEKTLKPRANELITAGFAGETFIQLLKSNPRALNHKSTLLGLQFWKKFVNNSEEVLLKLIRYNRWLMNANINKVIPIINLLREYGLSEQHITLVLTKNSNNLMLRDVDSMKMLLERAENLGLQRGSIMFTYGLGIVANYKKETIERKIKFFKNTYNWSDEEVNQAIKICPNILRFSEENVKSTMDYLITKFGLESKIIALQPGLLMYSLKRRLIPRNYVINMLKSKGVDVNYAAGTVIRLSEEKFLEKFIMPYKVELPELSDSYLALRSENMKN